MNRSIAKPAVGFITLIACFALVARYFGVTIQAAAGVSVVILLAPYWAFGFGLDNWIRAHLRERVTQVLAPQLLIVAYIIFALPGGQFHWNMCLGMAGIVLAIALLLQHANSTTKDQPDWHDWLVLAILGVWVDCTSLIGRGQSRVSVECRNCSSSTRDFTGTS